jgi:glycosyltransferase involved in cell wall biosynthesis
VNPSGVKTGPTARVLHVLGSLGMGGAETWLMQVARFLDPNRIRVDVAVNNPIETSYTRAVRERGWNILDCPSLQNPLGYARGFARLLSENGPYDVVHSHLQVFSGLILRVAHTAGVPVRIAHSRNSSDGKRLTPARWLYRGLMRQWLARYSTALLAVSRNAALGAFGPTLGNEKHCRLMTAVDLAPFQQSVDAAEYRRQLALPENAKVVGHVGSFRRQKNHGFLLEVAKSVASKRDDVVFLLVGDGSGRPEFEQRLRDENLTEQVRVLGERPDVPALMLGAMDGFMLPSLHEGMPRVLVEAQAAGLACLASSTIDSQAAAYPGAVKFLRLDSGPEAWAAGVLECLVGSRDPNRAEAAITAFTRRGLTPEANAGLLSAIYAGAVVS